MTTLLPQKPTLPVAGAVRCTLVSLEFVRSFRGCDAEAVLSAVADGTNPHCLRWVFNLAVKADASARRELRFWKDEIMRPETVDRAARPETVIDRILGERAAFSRTALEVQWTLNATTISRLVRHREFIERNRMITRASLAAFLLRRLQ
jgi:hypothetical protein